jgi:phosphatidylserine decarboxylase
MEFAPGAYRWAMGPLVAGTLAAIAYPPVAALGLALSVAVLLFFRDPDRSVPAEGVVAPADGRVSVVREEGDQVRVGVFMNVTDVHVNRAPVGGPVESVGHEPGGHWPAFSKASERNERRRITFEDHEVVQIAGTVARRTHAYVEAGDDLTRGERLGHIAFGSRVDVVLPERFDPEDLQVSAGESVTAGETVVAR